MGGVGTQPEVELDLPVDLHPGLLTLPVGLVEGEDDFVVDNPHAVLGTGCSSWAGI